MRVPQKDEDPEAKACWEGRRNSRRGTRCPSAAHPLHVAFSSREPLLGETMNKAGF